MPNVSDAAQKKVGAVRLLLERKTVTHDFGLDVGGVVVPDPVYAGLRELVEERNTILHTSNSDGDIIHIGHSAKGCPGYHIVTRDWTHSLSGTLWGAALERLPKGWWIETASEGEQALMFRSPVLGIFPLDEGGDHDHAIMTALKLALMTQLEAANAV